MRSSVFGVVIGLLFVGCTDSPLRAEAAYSERDLQAACDGVRDRWQAQFPADQAEWIAECRASLLRGDEAIAWYDAQRRVYNDIVVRQDLLANDENLTDRMRVRRSQIHILGVQDKIQCFRLVAGAGMLGYDPSYVLPRSVINEESFFMKRLFDQTIETPERYVLTEEDRAAAEALEARQLAKRSAAERAVIKSILDGYTGPLSYNGMSALCEVARSALDEVLLMSVPQRTRTVKALLLTGRGWMVAQTKTTDPWALRPSGEKTELYPWRPAAPPPTAPRGVDLSDAI